jgi:AcrR family transcriptional regulator
MGANTVADAEGADAVSMRRIAQVLKSGTMSLYWHVASKEQLLDLMLDALVEEVRVPEPLRRLGPSGTFSTTSCWPTGSRSLADRTRPCTDGEAGGATIR